MGVVLAWCGHTTKFLGFQRGGPVRIEQLAIGIYSKIAASPAKDW